MQVCRLWTTNTSLQLIVKIINLFHCAVNSFLKKVQVNSTLHPSTVDRVVFNVWAEWWKTQSTQQKQFDLKINRYQFQIKDKKKKLSRKNTLIGSNKDQCCWSAPFSFLIVVKTQWDSTVGCVCVNRHWCMDISALCWIAVCANGPDLCQIRAPSRAFSGQGSS